MQPHISHPDVALKAHSKAMRHQELVFTLAGHHSESVLHIHSKSMLFIRSSVHVSLLCLMQPPINHPDVALKVHN